MPDSLLMELKNMSLQDLDALRKRIRNLQDMAIKNKVEVKEDGLAPKREHKGSKNK